MTETNSKRKKTVVLKNPPFDCFGVIMQFFERPSDFLNLVCSIEGLYKYVSTINPYFTENIRFVLSSSFPSETMNHVTNLTVVPPKCRKGKEKRPQSFYDEISCDDLGDIFQETRSLFPNLLNLETNLSPDIFRIFRRDDITLISEKEDKSFQALRKLELKLYPCNLSFDFFLPKLKHLSLISENCEKIGRKKIYVGDLYVNFEKLPKLDSIKLNYWYKVNLKKGNFQKIKNKIKELEFKFPSGSLEKGYYCKFDEIFEKLETLCLPQYNKQFEIKRLPNLKKIELYGVYKTNKDFRLSLNGKNHPSLESIIFRDFQTRRELDDSKIEFKNLPKVCNLTLQNVYYPLSIELTPKFSEFSNLKHLRVLNCVFDVLDFGNGFKDLLNLENLFCDVSFFNGLMEEKELFLQKWKKSLKEISK